MTDNYDDDNQHYSFVFTDFDGVTASVSRDTSDGFAWPLVLLDIVNVLEKQFGYPIAEDVTVKGTCLADLREDPLAYFSPLQRLREIDEELELFPETSAGLTD